MFDIEVSTGQLVTEAQELDIRAFLNGHRSNASGAAYNMDLGIVSADEFERVTLPTVSQPQMGSDDA